MCPNKSKDMQSGSRGVWNHNTVIYIHHDRIGQKKDHEEKLDC